MNKPATIDTAATKTALRSMTAEIMRLRRIEDAACARADGVMVYTAAQSQARADRLRITRERNALRDQLRAAEVAVVEAAPAAEVAVVEAAPVVAAKPRTEADAAFAAVRAAEKLSEELSAAMFATDPLLAGPRRDELREKLRVARIAELEARAAFRKAIADARALS